MFKRIGVVFSVENLYFVAIMLATVAVIYMVAKVINAVKNAVEERSAITLGIVDSLSIPLMLFILNAGYGIAFQFLTLPLEWSVAIFYTPSIILILNLGFAVLSIIHSLLPILVRNLTLKTVKTISLIIGIAFFCIIILTYYSQLISVLVSAALTLLFIFVSQAILSSSKSIIRESPIVPKKLVISHIYLSIAESHDQMAQALDVIKKAIAEVPGTGDKPQVTASGFTPGAIDLLVKYYIVDASKMEEIKSDVNLNIVRRLSEEGIKLSSA